MASALGILLLTTFQIVASLSVNDDVQKLAAATTDMGLNIYREVSKTADTPNVFLSPYSIATALTLTYQGAKGETEKEMADVLGYSSLISTNLNADYKMMNAAIDEVNKQYSINTANRLYGRTGSTFLDSFLNPLEEYYNAPLEQKDFVTQAEQARKEINEWVAEQTVQKIKELLPKNSLTPSTVLVLVNAIYFKGGWVQLFKKEQTTEEKFQFSQNLYINVPMMRIDQGNFKMAFDNEIKAKIIRLPYEGDGESDGPKESDDIAMYIILPDEIDGLSQIENSLTAAKLNEMINKMKYQRIATVKVPQFNISQKFQLSDTLQNLGMKKSFTSQADFSGMTGSRGINIDEVYHEAVIEVNEEGTTAAAATGVTMRESGGSDPLNFIADRPFLFLIREEDTGSTLFLGKLQRPDKGSIITENPDKGSIITENPTTDQAAQFYLSYWLIFLLLTMLSMGGIC